MRCVEAHDIPKRNSYICKVRIIWSYYLVTPVQLMFYVLKAHVKETSNGNGTYRANVFNFEFWAIDESGKIRAGII